ncbi:MAG: KEOPS complex subunit Cgi121 [Nitrososphaerota archaeon]|nr:KEOPS complex subunit Cgi121 [Candidatus Calditenuaceae archaeon]MDW8073732.1 KEOPS complex subunit Cgi121 [Nitrososphaerota archaeon]
MAEIIRSSYGPYKFAAALINGLRRSPLELLADSQLRSVQFCRPEVVASERHLIAAFAAAATTTLSGVARSRRIEVEFILRLSCQRQIQDALRVAGLTGEEESVVAAAITEGDEDPEQLLVEALQMLGGVVKPFERTAPPQRLMELYGISEAQLETVPRTGGIEPLELLIIEKVVSSYVS